MSLADLKVSLSLDASSFNAGLASAEGRAGSASSGIGGIFQTMAGFVGGQAVVGAFHAIAGSVVGLGQSMIDSNAEFEGYEARFASLLGSTDAAKAKIEDLSKFASTTPFELPEVIQASQNMRTLGGAAFDTSENLQLIGNAAAATGNNVTEVSTWMSRAYGAIQSGRPFGEAAARLQEMGILSGDARAEVEKMAKAGTSSAEVWATFAGSLNAPGDAMEKLGGTFTGLKSTLSDNWSALVRTMGQPIFEAAKTGVQGLITVLATPAVQDFAMQIGTTLAGALSTVLPLVTAVVGALATGDTAGLLALFPPELQSIITTVSGALSTVVPIVTQVAGVISGIASGGGGGLLALFPPDVQAAITTAGSALAAYGASVVGLVSQVLAYAPQMASGLMTTFQTAYNVVMTILPPIFTVVAAVYGQVAAFLNANGAQIAGFVMATWTQIQGIIQTAMYLIQAIVVPVFSTIGAFIAEHGAAIQAVLQGAWTIITTVIGTALSTIQNLVSAALNIVTGNWQGAWENLKTIVSTQFQAIYTILDTLTGGLISRAVQFGSDLINGIVQGVEAAGAALYDALSNIANDALSAAKAALGISSPSKVFADVVGAQIPAGIAQGVADNAAVATNAASTLASSLTGATTKSMDALIPSLERYISVSESGLGPGTAEWAQALSDVTQQASALGPTVSDALNNLMTIYADAGAQSDEYGEAISYLYDQLYKLDTLSPVAAPAAAASAVTPAALAALATGGTSGAAPAAQQDIGAVITDSNARIETALATLKDAVVNALAEVRQAVASSAQQKAFT